MPEGTPGTMLVTGVSWLTPSSHLQMFFGQLFRPAHAVTHLGFGFGFGSRGRVRVGLGWRLGLSYGVGVGFGLGGKGEGQRVRTGRDAPVVGGGGREALAREAGLRVRQPPPAGSSEPATLV